jgi:hypothetical protein
MRQQLLIKADQCFAPLPVIVIVGPKFHVAINLFILVLLGANYSSNLAPILLDYIKVGLKFGYWLLFLLI